MKHTFTHSVRLMESAMDQKEKARSVRTGEGDREDEPVRTVLAFDPGADPVQPIREALAQVMAQLKARAKAKT